MKIVVAVKVVPDDQDIFVSGDRTLDYSKAKPKISEYDKNAIEAAAQLAAANDGSSVAAISAVPSKNDDTKAKQNILALGIDELFMATDDALETADSYATAQVLKNVVETNVADYDLIICGDGSADMYAGQVNVQLAAALGVPTINEVTAITAEGDKIVVERTLDDEIEEIEVPLPAVISVSPDIAPARIAGMRDILAAKKKPQTVAPAAVAVDTKVAVEDIKAPELAPRKNQIFEEGDIDAFAAAVAEALK
jgi:electron transfer flavoprotein beta subunit